MYAYLPVTRSLNENLSHQGLYMDMARECMDMHPKSNLALSNRFSFSNFQFIMALSILSTVIDVYVISFY